MSNFKKRVRNIEEKTGIAGEKNYVLIHLGYWPMNRFERKDKICYQKDNFKGHIVIIEEQGKSSRWIDSSSEEGKRILLRRGYKVITEDNDTETLT